jgi:hypothetical protein
LPALDGNAGIAAKAIIATFGADTLRTTVVSDVDAGDTLDGLCDVVIQMGLIESLACSSDMSSFVEYVYGNVVSRELNAFENAMIGNIACVFFNIGSMQPCITTTTMYMSCLAQ